MLFNGKNKLFFQRKFIHERKNFREFVMAMNNNNRHPGVKLLYSVSFDWISQFTPILLEKKEKKMGFRNQSHIFGQNHTNHPKFKQDCKSCELVPSVI